MEQQKAGQQQKGGVPTEEELAAAAAMLDPFPDLSEEEVMQLLERYEKSGASLGPVPDDLPVSNVLLL